MVCDVETWFRSSGIHGRSIRNGEYTSKRLLNVGSRRTLRVGIRNAPVANAYMAYMGAGKVTELYIVIRHML